MFRVYHPLPRGVALIFCVVLACVWAPAPGNEPAARDSVAQTATPSAAQAPNSVTGPAVLAASTQPAGSSESKQVVEPNRNSDQDHHPTASAQEARLGDDLAAAVLSAVQRESYQCSAVLGGAFGKFPFQSVRPDGVLIGFRVGPGKFVQNDIIQFLQPIYLTSSGEKLGKGFGIQPPRLIQIKAPAGCAVSGVAIRGGGALDALTVSFMRIKGTQLNPAEGYVSGRIGGPGGSDARIGGDGTPVIGICGRCALDGKWLGLGLVFLQPTPTADPDQAR